MGPLFALGAAVAWGLGDFMGAVKSRRLTVLRVLGGQQAWGLVIVATVVLVSAGAAPAGDAVLIAFLSGMFQSLGMAFYYQALTSGVMGIVAPISATGALVPLAAGLASGDDPSALQGAGIFLAVMGVMAAAYQPTEGEVDRKRIAVGAGMALLAASSLGTFYVLLDVATDDAELSWVVLINRVGAVLVLIPVALAIKERLQGDVTPQPCRPVDVAVVILVGSVATSANFLYAAATTHGMLSIVSVIGALYPVTTVILAWLFLGEKMRGVQRAGTATALAGVALVSI